LTPRLIRNVRRQKMKAMIEVPEIYTERLLLSGLIPSDAQAVFEYARTEAVARFTSWEPHRTIDQSEQFIHHVLEKASQSGGRAFHCWAIRLVDDSRAIGTVSFKQESCEAGRIDYALSQEHWNRGIVTEAVSAVIDWAFEKVPSLEVVESGGLTENSASMRVLQKCGMKLKRRFLQKYSRFGDEEKEVSEYSITRAEWIYNRGASNQAVNADQQ
jgi:ribosomal-protein-alanine N-acetyltransferase